MGKGRKTHVHPDARRAPPVPGDGGPCPSGGHPAAALRVRQRPRCWRVESASGQLLSNWGGRPRRSAHRIGGRASRSMRWWASVDGSRGRSGLLAIRRLRIRSLPAASGDHCGCRRGRQLEQVLPTKPRGFASNKAVRSAPAAGQPARADATHDPALRAHAAIAGGRTAATVAATGHLAPEMKRLLPSLVRGFPASCRSGSGYI